MVENQFGASISAIWQDKNASREMVRRYESDVRAELGRILQSFAGRALADSLRFHVSRGDKEKIGISIMPYEGYTQNAEEDKASVNLPYHSVVLFSKTTKNKGAHYDPATLPHEVLHHELVHSLRRVSRQMNPHSYKTRKDWLKRYDTSEEFIAILATDIFISDRTNHHKTGLRRDHQGHTPLDPELAESFRFFLLGTAAYTLIANFCRENAGYTRMLANVPARFNPIAAYYRNPKKAFDFAAEGDAKTAFSGMTPLDYAQSPTGVWRRTYSFPDPRTVLKLRGTILRNLLKMRNRRSLWSRLCSEQRLVTCAARQRLQFAKIYESRALTFSLSVFPSTRLPASLA